LNGSSSSVAGTTQASVASGLQTREPIAASRPRRPVGRVYIIPERCKECKYCWTFCPPGILELSDEINAGGYHHPRVKKGRENDCTNCGMCSRICPEFAIFTMPAGTTP